MERKNGTGAKPSPEERYRNFEKDNANWDRKVKKSIREIDKASRRGTKRAAAGS